MHTHVRTHISSDNLLFLPLFTPLSVFDQDYPKLSASYYSLLEVLTQDHMEFINSLEPDVCTRRCVCVCDVYMCVPTFLPPLLFLSLEQRVLHV